MNEITVNGKTYRITYEQNSYYMVSVKTNCGPGGSVKWYDVGGQEKRDAVNALLNSNLAEDEELLETYEAFLAGTR